VIFFWISLLLVFGFTFLWFRFLNNKIKISRSNFNERKILSNVALLIILIDCLVTLIGQPRIYWFNFLNPDEGSVLGAILLKTHPLLFTIVLIIYAFLINFLIRFFFWNLSRVLFLLVFLGHGMAIYSWIWFALFNLVFDRVNLFVRSVAYDVGQYLYLFGLVSLLSFLIKRYLCKEKGTNN